MRTSRSVLERPRSHDRGREAPDMCVYLGDFATSLPLIDSKRASVSSPALGHLADANRMAVRTTLSRFVRDLGGEWLESRAT